MTDNHTVQRTWDLLDETSVSQMEALIENYDIFDNNQSASTYGIVGEDTREFTSPTTAPYCSVALIIATMEDGGTSTTVMGTAFLVSPNVLVSAAHCAIPKNLDDSFQEMKIYFDVHQESNLSGQTYVEPRRISYSPNWHDTSVNSNYDYCIIELEENISRPFYFNCVMSSNISTPQTVSISGYPGDHKFYQMTSQGELFNSNEFLCTYYNDTYGGMSGSPIYNASTCIGIHTRRNGDSYNIGNLFTADIYNLICETIAENSCPLTIQHEYSYTDNGNGTHTRYCACGYSETHDTVYFDYEDGETHAQFCDSCSYWADLPHNCTYKIIFGASEINRLTYHIKACRYCGYSDWETHDWQFNGTNYTCTLCKMTSTSAPGLMSIPKDESKVAAVIPEADACCTVDSAVYYVAILPEAVTETEGQTSCSHPVYDE